MSTDKTSSQLEDKCLSTDGEMVKVKCDLQRWWMTQIHTGQDVDDTKTLKKTGIHLGG